MIRFTIMLLITAFAVSAVYAEDACPSRLFYISKSTNSNIVMYELNLSEDGQLDSEKPLTAYWTRLGADTQIKLGFLERKLAYGVNYLDGDNEEFYIAAFPKQILSLDSENGCLMAYTRINGEKALLENVFVMLKGSGITSDVQAITLTGVALSTGETVIEKITSEFIF